MPATETTRPETEIERIERWRRGELERAGYPTEAAAEIASRLDVDLHQAVQLLERGCPADIAARILLQQAGLALLGSIPSPANGVLDLGPLHVHLYGLILVVAIAAAVALGGTRWVRTGTVTWEVVFRVTVWGVVWGVIGARAYHCVTSWDQLPDAWWGFAAVWKGGLGIWGAIAGGVTAGAVVARRAGADVALGMDCVAPGLVLAQAIGRLGNWTNQELFGGPTSLPWGLEISPDRRPAGYERYATFHPTFLYELLWNLAVCVTLLLVGRRFRMRPPALFFLYVALYTFGRFWFELMRIDPAHHILGVRVNVFVAAIVFAVAVALVLRYQRRGGQAPLRGE